MNPFKKKNEKASPAIILDTCALIDGRVIEIAKAGFVPQDVVIPQFIIAELQYLADYGDSHKRERARYGLDVIRELQDLRRTEVSIAREQFKNIKEVDDKLIALAKQYGAMLYTTDYNLNKVAQIEGVMVLNVNELAQALRPRRLPGERIELKITQAGQDKTQGVGYLDDGTMVVVEKAGNKIGQRIQVEFSRMLQTQAGKMMFAVLPKGGQPQAAPVPVVPPQSHQPKPQPQQREPQTNEPTDKKRPQVSTSQNQRRQVYHARNNKRHDKHDKNVSNRQPITQTRNRRQKASPEDALLSAIERSESNDLNRQA